MIEKLLQDIVKRVFELEKEYFDTHIFGISDESKIKYIAQQLREEL